MQSQYGSSKFLQNNFIVYEYHGYFVYVFGYRSCVYKLPQASAVIASRSTTMSYVAPAEYWLAYVPNAWDRGKTKTLTCLLCNKTVQWLPWHQNGAQQANEHANKMRQLSFTSGTYYEIKRRRAQLHPEAEPAPEAQDSTPLSGWTSHIQEGTGRTFYYHEATKA